MAGKLIVIEGLDGSGKATQAKRLAAALQKSGFPVREISFPNYESESSALVRMYLAGAFGNAPGDVNAWAASLFFAVDRYAGMKQDWGGFYESGGILIADRYTTSNAVHQSCKLAPYARDEYLNWLFELEFGKLGLPKPDLTLYLRLPVETSLKLMRERYHGDEEKKDIHERDGDYLISAHEAADYCAAALSWTTVECVGPDGALRPIDSIAEEVLRLASACI